MTNFNLNFRSRSGTMGIGGKLFASLILLFFIVGGCVIFRAMLHDMSGGLASRSWPTTSCKIVSAYIPEKPPYKAIVHYTYAQCGQTYQSQTVSINDKGTDDYYDAQKILNAYPPGTSAVCQVNPADPSQSVLRIPKLWIVAQLLFPMVFLTIGGGGLLLVWKTGNANAATAPAPRTRQIPAFLGVIFSIVGLIMIGVLVPMSLRYQSAQSWQSAPCTIVQSKVGTHVSHGKHGDSTTYSIDVLFRYTFNGQPHDSSRYKLSSVSDGNYADKAKMVDYLNRNRLQTCYVNPNDPDDAVIDRSFLAVMLIPAGIGLMLEIAGLAILRARWRSKAAA